MNNHSEIDANVLETYRAVQQEHLLYSKASLQSDIITLTGIAGLYSWLIVAKGTAPDLLWAVGPTFIIFAFARGHTLTRHLEKLRAFLHEIERSAIKDGHALRNAWEEYRGLRPPLFRSNLRKIEARLIPFAPYVFWSSLLLVTAVLAVLRWKRWL